MTDNSGSKPDKGLASRLRRLARETLTKAAGKLLESALAVARGVQDRRRLPAAPGPRIEQPAPTAASKSAKATAPAAAKTTTAKPAAAAIPATKVAPVLVEPPVPLAPPPGISPVPPPPASPRSSEPLGMLDLAEPPLAYGTDEVHLIPQDPGFLFFYWEVTPGGWDRARGQLHGDGVLTFRLWSTGDDGRTDEVDVTLDWDHGRSYLAAPRSGAHVSGAVGLRAPDGRFAAICHAPRTRVPWAEPAPDAPATAVTWMIVEPDLSRGTAPRTRPTIAKEGSSAEVKGAQPAGAQVQRWREGVWEHVGSSRTASGVVEREHGDGDRPTSPWRWPRNEAP